MFQAICSFDYVNRVFGLLNVYVDNELCINKNTKMCSTFFVRDVFYSFF